MLFIVMLLNNCFALRSSGQGFGILEKSAFDENIIKILLMLLQMALLKSTTDLSVARLNTSDLAIKEHSLIQY